MSGQHSAKKPRGEGEVPSRADSTKDENSMRQYNIYTQVIQKCKVIMCNSYSIKNKCYFCYSLELLTDRRLDFKKNPSPDS